VKGTPRVANADTRNRQARGDRRRQQILDAAVELFAAKGYRSTGIRTLAEQIGFSDAGLLYYFGTKERLLHAVVTERPPARFPVPGDELTLSHLRDLGRRYDAERTLIQVYTVLATESLSEDEPLKEFFVRRFHRGVEVVAEILEQDRVRGKVRADIDIPQIATEILATELGMELMWLMDPDSIDIAVVRRQWIDRLVDDLSERYSSGILEGLNERRVARPSCDARKRSRR
jgi:AcrR family transcriptional regulator